MTNTLAVDVEAIGCLRQGFKEFRTRYRIFFFGWQYYTVPGSRVEEGEIFWIVREACHADELRKQEGKENGARTVGVSVK